MKCYWCVVSHSWQDSSESAGWMCAKESFLGFQKLEPQRKIKVKEIDDSPQVQSLIRERKSMTDHVNRNLRNGAIQGTMQGSILSLNYVA